MDIIPLDEIEDDIGYSKPQDIIPLNEIEDDVSSPGYFETFGDVAKAGLYKTGGMFGGLAQAVEENTGLDYGWGKETSQMAQGLVDSLKAKYPETSGARDAIDIGGSAIPAIGVIAAAPLAGAVAAPLTVANLAFQNFGQRYPQLREEGATPTSAALGAGADSAVNAVIDRYLEVPRLLAGTSLPRKIIENAGINYLSAIPQTLSSQAVDYFSAGKTITPEEAQDQLSANQRNALIMSPLYGTAGWAGARGTRRASDATDTLSQQQMQGVAEGTPIQSQIGLDQGFVPQTALPAYEQRLGLPDAPYSVGDNFTARDLTPIESAPRSEWDAPRPPLVVDAEVPILPGQEAPPVDPFAQAIEAASAKAQPDNGIQVEQTSARTPEQQIESEGFKNLYAPMDEASRPPMYDERGRPVTEAAGYEPPAPTEVFDPFTKTGQLRKALSPEELAAVESLKSKGYVVQPPSLQPEIPPALQPEIPILPKAELPSDPIEAAVQQKLNESGVDSNGIILETSSSRSNQFQNELNNIASGRSQSRIVSPQDAQASPSSIITSEGVNARSSEIISPFTDTGNFGKGLSPEEQSILKGTQTLTPRIEDVAPTTESFPDVKGKVKKALSADEQVALNKARAKRKSQRGSISFKSVDPKDAHTNDGISQVEESLGSITERDFSKTENRLMGNVTIPGVGKVRSSDIAGFNQFFSFPKTIAKKDRGMNIAYEGAMEYDRNVHRVAEASGKHFEPYYNAPDNVKKQAVNGLYALEAATKNRPDLQATPELLSKIGMSPEAVIVAMGIRNGFDTALKTSEDAAIIRMKGDLVEKVKATTDPNVQSQLIASIPQRINEIKTKFAEIKATNYMPRSRFGQYFTETTMPNGEKYFAMHESRFAANADAKRLSKMGLDVNKGLLAEAHSSIPNLGGTAAVNFASLDPDTTHVSKGFEKHFAKSKDIQGYSTDFDRVAADYVTSAARWSAKQVAQVEFNKAKADLAARGLNKDNSETYRYVERYIDYQNNPPKEYVAAKKFLTNYYLGLNIKSAAINLTQTVTTTIPEMYKHVGVMGSWKAMGKAYADAASYKRNPDAFAKKNPELHGAIQKALSDGSISEQVMRDLTGRASGSSLQKYLGNKEMSDFTMGMFDSAEGFNRLSSFIAGMDIAKQKGLTGDTAVKFSEDLVDNTQFNYSKANKPEFARSKIGNLVSTFRLFQLNYLSSIKNNMNSKDYKTAVGLVTHMLALGGITAFPGAKIAIAGAEAAGYDPIDYIRKLFGYGSNADSLIYGIPAGKGGINISGSVGLGDMGVGSELDLPSASLSALTGVTSDPIKRIGKAAYFYDLGQDARAAESVLPEFARGPAKAYRAYNEGLRNAKNIPLMSGKTPLTAENMSAFDLTAMAGGFNPMTSTKAYEQQHSIETKVLRARDNDNINFKIAMKMYEGDFLGAKKLRQEVRENNKTLPPYMQIKPDEDSIKSALKSMKTGQKGNTPKKARYLTEGIATNY